MTRDGDFDDVPLANLERDVVRSGKDEDLSGELNEQRLRRHTQANDMRDKFYGRAVLLASATVATSVLLVIGYAAAALIHGFEMAPAVAVGFISGLAVETVGVLLVMAGYLFPKDRGADD